MRKLPDLMPGLESKMLLRAASAAIALGAILVSAGCTPTVRVEVAPINIYARLDADVRVRLDQEVQSLIQQNPNLF